MPDDDVLSTSRELWERHGAGCRSGSSVSRKHVVLTANSGFKIANYRAGLVDALLTAGHAVTVIAPHDRHMDRLATLGCQTLPLAMARQGTAPLAEIRLFLDVFRKIRRSRPDIVFSYTVKNNIYSGLACRMLGIPFAPNVTGLGHSFDTRGVLRLLVRKLYRISFRRALAVLFQNCHDFDVFLRGKLAVPDNMQLLPGSGVNLQRFAASPVPDIGKEVRFLFVGRLIWDKGLGVLVKSLRGLRAEFPNIRCDVLGPLDPSSRSAIPERQIREWEAEGLLTWLGSTDDVRPAMAQAHCILQPSYYREGLPKTLLEASALARPVVATDIPGCRDAVIHGKTGFLCRPNDPESLAKAMRSILTLGQTEMDVMGRAGRSRAEDSFSEQIVIDRYVAMLQAIR